MQEDPATTASPCELLTIKPLTWLPRSRAGSPDDSKSTLQPSYDKSELNPNVFGLIHLERQTPREGASGRNLKLSVPFICSLKMEKMEKMEKVCLPRFAPQTHNGVYSPQQAMCQDLGTATQMSQKA